LAYSRPRANGINAITIREGDELIEASLTNGESEILLALRSGKAIRFKESKVRAMGRNAAGVRGITLSGPDDEVVGMVCVKEISGSILVVAEKGYGKRSSIDSYRLTNRGGKGVKTINITKKTGALIAILHVKGTEDLMIINKNGITIRLSISALREVGRATQGVKLINLSKDDKIASVAKIKEHAINGNVQNDSEKK